MNKKILFFILSLVILAIAYLLLSYFLLLKSEINPIYKNLCNSSEFTNKLNITNLPYSEGQTMHLYGNLISVGNEYAIKDLSGQIYMIEGAPPKELSTSLLHVIAESKWGYSYLSNKIEINIISSEEIPYTVIKGFLTKRSVFNMVEVRMFFLYTFNGFIPIKLELEGNKDIENILDNQTNKFIKVAGIVKSVKSKSNFFLNTNKEIPTFLVRYICTN